ncbi:hypothetical protein R0K18_35150, partial [Pantoea sp. SIMBA_133]
EGVTNKHEIEQLRQVLVSRMGTLEPAWSEGKPVLVDVHQKVREDFYEALTAFASCLKVALQSSTFFEDSSFTDDDRRHY